MNWSLSVVLRLALIVVVLLSWASPAGAQGWPIGFEETFALADDREAVLDELVPGSPEWFFHRCLVLQHEGQFERVGAELDAWVATHGRGDERITRIRNRQALLTYARDPAATFEYLRDELEPRLDHRRQIPGEVPDLPTALDPARIDTETLIQAELAREPRSVSGFEPAAYPALLEAELTVEQRRSLLDALDEPDHPELLRHVLTDLQGGIVPFGGRAIHERLLLAQLEELADRRPQLLESQGFVETWVARLLPGPAEDREDPVVRRAMLARLEAFARRLPPVHNSLLALVLHHRLELDREQGLLRADVLREYMAMPRNTSWRDLPRDVNNDHVVSPDRTYDTGLERFGDDAELVRACLTELFRDAEDWSAFAGVAHDEFLRTVFAESKLLHGVGDAQRWASLLDDPARLEALRDRVEIVFAPTQPWRWGPRERVVLEADVKNVDTLLLKVFEIDAFHVYSELGSEVGLRLDLDGIVPNHETVLRYDESPMQRVRRRFELPELDAPGVYIVELVGNGIASRALVRKGALRMLERVGPAGHQIHVLDEQGQVLEDAAVWLDGRQFEAGEGGLIVVPFTTEPGRRALVLRHGERATRTFLEHQPETYRLDLAANIDREALLPGEQAQLAARPTLRVGSEPISIALLEDAVLTLTATDLDGVETTQQLRDPELRDEAEFVHVFSVPERLVSVVVELSGTVRSLSLGNDVALSDSEVFRFNWIARSDTVAAAMLRPTPDGFVLDLFGRAGEPVPERAVRLELGHRALVDGIDVSLRTDERGRVRLGALEGIERVSLHDISGGAQLDVWDLPLDDRSWPKRLAGSAGESLRVPWPRGLPLERAEVALLELGHRWWLRDRFEHLALADGVLELRGLPPGDYDLMLRRPGVQIPVHVRAGAALGDWIVGERWSVERSAPALHVTDLRADGDALVVQLAHAGPEARVHVQVDRWLPAFDPYSSLVAPLPDHVAPEAALSLGGAWEQGRVLSDALRYVLERRYAARFPGNMLPRPSLLLNPWALEESSSDVVGVGAGSGGSFGGKVGKRAGAAMGGRAGRGALQQRSPARFADLGFLPEPARSLLNLRPDADGVVRVPLAELGPGTFVQVLAVDDVHTVSAGLALPERELTPRDVCLRAAVDPQRAVIEQRRIEFLDAGATRVLDDLASARVELIDSLPAAYALFMALRPSAELQRFAFLLEWPELSAERKRALYSEYASHELHLFLHEKDRAFFDEVVRPYLAHKLHKTFLDRWLLEDDLGGYLEPWSFARLNVMERVLLGRRLPEHAAAITRQLDELLALRAPDPGAERMRFEAALLGRGLETEAGLGAVFFEAREQLEQLGYLGGQAEDDAFAAGFEPQVAVVAEEVMAEPVVVFDSPAHMTGRGRRRAADQMSLRRDVRALYRAPDPTRLWVEQHYWKRRVLEGVPLPVNGFWVDFAHAGPDAPFVSPRLAEASGSLNEMLLALALLELPFEPGEHHHAIDGARGSVTAGSPLLLVTKALADAPRADDGGALLVSERVVSAVEPERVVSDEFLVGEVYSWQVVVTNPTVDEVDVELLVQVPAGAVALAAARATGGSELHLEPFATEQLETRFYFPLAGDFAHTPVRVARAGEVVASTEPRLRHVVREPTAVDETSWEHVSQRGSEEQLLAWLAGANLREVDLARMAWRMADRDAFLRITSWLRARNVFDGTLWAYGLLHEDARTTRELLPLVGRLADRCGPVLDSLLLGVDPELRGVYEHIEFEPLFNQRAHPFGDQRRIHDPALAEQYRALLDVLVHTPRLGDREWFAVCYFMLLQDRVQDALDAFARVDRARLGMDLQYDYARAYLAMYRADLTLARQLAEAYVEHPVTRWRERFAQLLAHVDEAEGRGDGARIGDDREARQAALVASEPSLELELDGGELLLRHANLERCELRYTLMDIELLFTANPFVQQGTEGLSLTRPARRDVLELGDDAGSTRVALPEEFAGRNVLVELRGGGLVRRLAHTSNRLAVQVIDGYGQLKVTGAESGTPLPAVYVKVFARTPSGEVRFHKDGYTDLRGRFDYASLSVDGASPAERFAILVLSDERGAVVREADAP